MGHSAGGQFTTRYEMSKGKGHDTLAIPISDVVSNPSSYAYWTPGGPRTPPAVQLR